MSQTAAIESQAGDGASGRRQAPAGPFHLTDYGNAGRFVARHGQDLRYCHPWAKWLVWDGRRWATDDAGEVRRRAKATVMGIYDEAARASDTARRQALAAWAGKSESEHRTKAMVSLARCEVPILTDALDADPWLLNVQNGTLDLRTGQLRPHERRHLITKLAPVVYDPDANAPRFEQFIREILDNEPDLIAFVQRLFGHCLTGDISEQIVPIFWGTGSNGKSTLVEVVTGLMGDYAEDAPPDLLMVRNHQEHPTELADLFGLRLMVASETEEGKRLRIQLVKKLSGDRMIKARRMRRDYFQFTRTHKTILVTNNKPIIREDTHAVWRRIRFVPFTVVVPDSEQDKALPEKLRAEWPGILRWCVDGCIAWQREGGLGTPTEVEEATDAYRQEQDVLADFLADRCLLHQIAWISRTELWRTYGDWAKANGEQFTLGRNAFYDRIRAIEGTQETWRREHGTEKRGWTGIGLAAADPPTEANR